MSLLRDIGTGVSAAATMGTPWGWAIGGAAVASSLFGATSKQDEYKEKIGVLGEKRTSALSALSGVDEIESQKIGIAEAQYGLGVDKSIFQTGQSLYGITRQGGSAAASTGFAFSGDVQKQVEKGIESGVESFGFTRRGLQDMLGGKLLNITEEMGATRGRLETEIASIDSEMGMLKKKSSAGGFFQDLFG
tara:strand:- start:5043 stop:5615 length:573 start_codon:yes stop_codon:yes gene_type:complete